jgi:hypothetical protein
MPTGFTRATIVKLPAEPRIHTLGGVRIDFRNAHALESASYALFKDTAQTDAFVRLEQHQRTGGVFHIAAARVGRIAVGVTAFTSAQAKALLQLAIAHLRRATA